MPTLAITLEDTYWSKGFFNISRDFEPFITFEEGAIDIYLGDSLEPIRGRVSRSANSNATPRVYGHKALAEFSRGTAAAVAGCMSRSSLRRN